jgi:hypothetical protein
MKQLDTGPAMDYVVGIVATSSAFSHMSKAFQSSFQKKNTMKQLIKTSKRRDIMSDKLETGKKEQPQKKLQS